MVPFPSYDPASDSIHLNGGATIMLTLLMKARFGERFDPSTLFHPGLTGLIRQLEAASDLPQPVAGQCFDHVELHLIASRVYDESINIGWWAMTDAEREAFLQDAVAPWRLSVAQVQTIVEGASDILDSHRRTVAAADKS